MRTLALAILATFPVLSSCGGGDGADGTTRGVSDDTRLDATAGAARETAPDGPITAAERAAVFDGFVGTRFAVVEAGTETRIADLLTRRVVAVSGRPVIDEPYAGDLGQFGIPPSVPARVARATKDGRRLVVVDAGGAHAIDTTTGARVASLRGVTSGAAVGDDDSVLVAWGGGEVRFGDMDGAWTASVALATEGEPRLSWHGRLVVVHTGSGDHVVDRATWSEWKAPAGDLVRVTDDGLAITHETGAMALWRVGEDAPPERFANVPDSAYVHVDAGHVAWSERTAQTESDERLTLHVVDRITRRERSFRGVGTCPIQPESIVATAEGEVTTDVTCNPGCASIEYQTHHVVYDAATGAVKHRVDGPISPPLTFAWGDAVARLDTQTARLGRTRESAVESPGAPGVFAFANEKELVLGDGVRGHVLRAMKGSEGAATPVFTGDGRFLAATTDRGVSVWDARTGAPVFSTDAPE